ncbi:restriction endonuclease subunit S [Arenibacter sp. S6351L]|uniref:restriction endonuclease subunit S n=1 Tax=Arenibacter sp. S6351L TaxID=2926407 RepID=UPI001FF2EAB4|nr:restriction endonuclease subunit S [Arenibacter sp. S6351L]MCK0137235.1 restriction endonuclease subunit S [Arenibacter sp. S6351L]
MSLNFKYIPLTFLNDVNIIKEQIKNTVILRYLFDEYGGYSKLENLITGTQYGYNASALQSGKNKFLRISDITDGKVDWDTVPFCDCSDEDTYLLNRNDLLIARTGGTTGKSFIINNPPDKAIYAGYLIRIRANKENNPEFLNLFLNSYVYWSQVVSMNKGEFRPSVNATKLKDLIVPKIDIEIQRDAVKISKCFSVDGFEELENNIQRVLNDFEKSQEIIKQIRSQEKSVELLKQSILQEAIQGQLTADWRTKRTLSGAEVEPASELLKRIKAEKAQLIKDKKIKKEKALPPILEEEIPFEIPEGWVWCRLGEILLYSDSGKSPQCEKRPANKNEWGVLTTTSIQSGYFLEKENKVLPAKFSINLSQKVEENDILITRAGPLNRTGISCKVNSIKSNLILSDKTIRLKHVPGLIAPDFLVSLLNSNSIRALLIPNMTGMAESQVNISQGNIKSTTIPLPPFEEQKAIVEKVELLMKKCQGLEEQIKTSEADAQMLMQAVLKEAFEGKQEVVEV